MIRIGPKKQYMLFDARVRRYRVFWCIIFYNSINREKMHSVQRDMCLVFLDLKMSGVGLQILFWTEV